MEIESGADCLLDGKTKVTVIRALNRAKTVFSVQLPEKGIDTVEKSRLSPLTELQAKELAAAGSEAGMITK
jgi:hypothetical protein